MTRLLDIAIDAATQLAPERQDEIARAILEIVSIEHGDVVTLSDADRAAVRKSREHAQRGDFASNEEVEAVIARYR